MTSATYSNPPVHPGVVRLRTGRLVVAILVLLVLLLGGGFVFLRAFAKPMPKTTPDTMTTNPAWMKQPITYAAEEQAPIKAVPPPADPNPGILRELAALRQQSQAQQEELEALKRRPVASPALPAKTPAKPIPIKRPPGGMLFVSHDKDLKDMPPVPRVPEYTLAPGATKIPCIVEPVINSDVEGYFTAKVTTNIYDTATGRHLLVPQGSTILAHDQSSQLVYGNERMNTVSLSLTLPDGRTVDLGKAPVTDEQGVAGLTGDVNQHYGRLLAAVLIQGVLKGGATAISTAAADATGAGPMAVGIVGAGSQAGMRVTGPLLSTRPTILVASGQLCTVLLVKPLSLPAMWQDGVPQEPLQGTTPPVPPMAQRKETTR